MRAPRFIASPSLVTAGLLVLVAVAACDNLSQSRHFVNPTAPTPTVYVPPPPVAFAPLQYTAIQIGEVVRERITDPPECVDFLGWPCRYFSVTAPTSGKLEVALTFAIDTNRNQGVDLTVRAADGTGGQTWAQFFAREEARVVAPVVAGKQYYITMWYTYAGMEFSLNTSVQ